MPSSPTWYCKSCPLWPRMSGRTSATGYCRRQGPGRPVRTSPQPSSAQLPQRLPAVEGRRHYWHTGSKGMRNASVHLPLSCRNLRKGRVVVNRHIGRNVYFLVNMPVIKLIVSYHKNICISMPSHIISGTNSFYKKVHHSVYPCTERGITCGETFQKETKFNWANVWPPSCDRTCPQYRKSDRLALPV